MLLYVIVTCASICLHTSLSCLTCYQSQVGDRNPNAVLAELKQFYTPLFGANTVLTNPCYRIIVLITAYLLLMIA